jgi:hypothetical protein
LRCLRLFRPIDPASIAVFRIAFGTLMVWEVWRYFSHDWIRRYYVTPGGIGYRFGVRRTGTRTRR